MVHILYNPKSGCGKDVEEKLSRVKKLCKNKESVAQNIVEIEDMKKYFDSLKSDDEIVLVGGDGTINVFVNKLRGYEIKNKLFLYKAGTGNDFMTDICWDINEQSDFIQINEYIENLPVVTVNGKEYLFINNVGYGIDGKVCTAAEDLKEKGKTEINYTTLAIKLLLTNYKRNNAIITVDGKKYRYKNVWMAPVMNGRFYGGGMMPTPAQNRDSDKVSCCIIHDTNALQTLFIFPSIFKGEHIKYKSKVTVLSGKEFRIEYDRPQDVQIDGETIRNVTEISVRKYASLCECDKKSAKVTV